MLRINTESLSVKHNKIIRSFYFLSIKFILKCLQDLPQAHLLRKLSQFLTDPIIQQAFSPCLLVFLVFLKLENILGFIYNVLLLLTCLITNNYRKKIIRLK